MPAFSQRRNPTYATQYRVFLLCTEAVTVELTRGNPTKVMETVVVLEQGGRLCASTKFYHSICAAQCLLREFFVLRFHGSTENRGPFKTLWLMDCPEK